MQARRLEEEMEFPQKRRKTSPHSHDKTISPDREKNSNMNQPEIPHQEEGGALSLNEMEVDEQLQINEEAYSNEWESDDEPTPRPSKTTQQQLLASSIAFESSPPKKGYFFLIRTKITAGTDIFKNWVLPSDLWIKTYRTWDKTASWIMGCSPKSRGVIAIHHIMEIQKERPPIFFLSGIEEDINDLPTDDVTDRIFDSSCLILQPRKTNIIDLVRNLHEKCQVLNAPRILDKEIIDRKNGRTWWTVELDQFPSIPTDSDLQENHIVTVQQFKEENGRKNLLCILSRKHELSLTRSMDRIQKCNWKFSSGSEVTVEMELAHWSPWLRSHYEVTADLLTLSPRRIRKNKGKKH